MITAAAAEPLRQLGYGQVQLAAGPLQRQARENHRLVLALDEDALLRPFRMRSGLTAPGHDLGGWYDTYALCAWRELWAMDECAFALLRDHG